MNAQHRLLNKRLLAAIQRSVSDRLETNFTVKTFVDRDEAASHPAALMSDGHHTVFVKLGDKDYSARQFECEREGLHWLHERGGARVPTVLDVVHCDGVTMQIQMAVNIIERGEQQWRDIGVALACLHNAEVSARCGFDADNFWGDEQLDHRWLPDWRAFYGSAEYDLAMLDLFSPMPNEVLEGYRSVRAIDAEFVERRALWLVAPWLAIVALDGPKWNENLRACVERYR